MDAGGGHGFHLVGGSALTSGDDGSGVTHAAAGRRGLAGDEPDDGFLDVLLDEFGCGFFCRAADFADHDDGVGFRIVVEQAEGVDVGGADDGVAAYADRGRLADAALGELVDSFVGEGSGAGDDADGAFHMDAAGHDADFGFAGGDDPGAVGADEARGRVLELGPDFDHVESGDAFSNADDEGDTRVFSFEDGVGGKRRRNEDHGGVGAGCRDGVGNGVEDGPAFVGCAAFAGSHASDDVGTVFGAAFGVEGAFFARKTLNNQSSILINQNRHLMLPPLLRRRPTPLLLSWLRRPGSSGLTP